MNDPNYYAEEYNSIGKKPKKIRILDSTLREGEQHPGVSFTVKQRIQIAWELDYFGVDQIEISPIISNDHAEATKTIIKQGLRADIVVKKVRSEIKTPLDAHVHNDIGFALANAFAACDAGADQIHTTIDGIGERTGIPSIAETAVALTYLYKSPNDFRLDMLADLSRLIEQYTDIRPYDSKPIVGSSAYKHKAGTHLAAVLRNPAAYEPINPRMVGNRRRIVFGELAGKTGAEYLMSLLGMKKDIDNAKNIAAGLKNIRMGDLIDIPLEDKMERKIISDKK